uniref:Uncharacterized protein n=1 Tax=Marseillevirus LCMAC101 TaxID=2506602 RepID=A0A481YRK1_9VIRU|nr:MAG: hypothetical protein LCMAC101_04880 [Marseillevirus LCMAC101]
MCLPGILIIALIVLVIVLMTGQTSGYRKAPSVGVQDNREEFGDILGTLGPYAAQIAAANNQTDQSDPSLRLQPWPAWNAGTYIQSIFTDMQKAGIPPEEPLTITSKCQKQCESNDPLASQKCTGMCYCHNSCRVSCAIDCQHTDDPTDDCMNGCMATKTTNCNQFSWGFAEH